MIPFILSDQGVRSTMSYQTALIGRVIGENSEGDCKAVAAFLILFLKRGSRSVSDLLFAVANVVSTRRGIKH